MGFTLNGTIYTVGCATITERFVTDDVIAIGVLNGTKTTVRRIADVDSGLIMAVDYPSGVCAGDATDTLGR